MLTDAQTRLYARQILVAEMGARGQERLCDARVAVADAAAASAASVALDYLARAGVSVTDPGGERHVSTALPVSVASDGEVRALAGDVSLVECAAWLTGAFAAVEAIKQIAGVGSAATLDPDLVLTAEIF